MDTGWKMPSTIAQDCRYGKVNKGTCYEYLNTKNILKTGTDTWANQQEWTAGTNNTHDAPLLYASNYNFNIPDNATITSIYVRCTSCRMTKNSSGKLYTKKLKLKLGASTTDGGSGNNVASQDQNVYKYRTWVEYVYKGDPESVWNCKLTPATINSSNFGCVYQVGNQNSSWCIPRVALMMIKVEYTVPTATITKTTSSDNTLTKTEVPAVTTITESAEFKVTLEQDDNKDNLDIYLKNKSTLTIKYQHITGSNGLYNSGSTPETKITATDLRVNNEKVTYSVPTTLVAEGTTGQTITQTVDIYPGALVGVQTVTVTYGTTVKTLEYTVKDTTPVSPLVTSEQFSNPAQRVYIDSCQFKSNKSNGDAGAIYVEGYHYTITNSTGTNNSASSVNECNNIKVNGECCEFTDVK